MSYFTYRNLSLNINGTDQHPIFMGPLMVHLKKDFDCYYYFTEQVKYYSDILFKNETFSVLDIKLIITDDDEGLNGALRKTFNQSDFVLCCNHLKKNIINILKDFEIDDVDKEKILYLIFGSTSEREKSLIASNSKIEYIEKLDLISKYFETLKGKSNMKSFSDWFLEHKARKIYDFFVRPNLKYKDKLNRYYTTNDIEGFNNSIKERIPKSKNNLTEIFSFFEEMANGQINSSKLAMIQSGDHEVSKLYKKSEIKANVWSMLGQTQQERKLEKFLKKWPEMEKKNTEKNVTSIYKLEN